MANEREFDAIFYDLGGTLRLVERDAEFEAEARRKIAEMCGENGLLFSFRFSRPRHISFTKLFEDERPEKMSRIPGKGRGNAERFPG